MSTSYLQRLVEVMDQLRSPGGCPWDAEQTHESLIKYLLEESYEFIESVESGNRQDMREELGDILLQVYFHSRIAEEDGKDPFTVDDVAKAVADKLAAEKAAAEAAAKAKAETDAKAKADADAAAKKKAEEEAARLAWNAPGVTEVENELAIIQE